MLLVSDPSDGVYVRVFIKYTFTSVDKTYVLLKTSVTSVQDYFS
jgi:hypothetical protein